MSLFKNLHANLSGMANQWHKDDKIQFAGQPNLISGKHRQSEGHQNLAAWWIGQYTCVSGKGSGLLCPASQVL